MALSKKITTAALIPTAFMVLFAVSISVYFWQHYRSASTIKQIAALINATSCLVHELQKERGMSAGFISSKGRKFTDILRKQREQTDVAISSFRNFSIHRIQDEKLKRMLGEIYRELDRIQDIRKKVDTLSVSKKEVVDFYTGINRKLIALAGVMVHHSKNVHIGARIIALKEFSKAKDFEGIKRALLSIVFAQDRFDEETLLIFLNIRGKEDSHLEWSGSEFRPGR